MVAAAQPSPSPLSGCVQKSQFFSHQGIPIRLKLSETHTDLTPCVQGNAVLSPEPWQETNRVSLHTVCMTAL